MKKIEAKTNAFYKEVKKLNKKKYRDLNKQYIAEGPNLVLEAINRELDIDSIIVREEDISNEEISSLVNLFKNKYTDGKLFLFSETLFKDIADTVTAQGILAVIDKNDFNKDSFVKEIREHKKNVLVLDRLQDPGNIGAIIRTAVGVGYGAVISVKGTADIYAPKVIRASAGAAFSIPIYFSESAEEVVEILKCADREIVTTGFETSTFYYDVDFKENKALVLGNEGNGVSREFFENSDFIVKIPMENKLESLNAAVAAGVIMYESVRK